MPRAARIRFAASSSPRIAMRWTFACSTSGAPVTLPGRAIASLAMERSLSPDERDALVAVAEGVLRDALKGARPALPPSDALPPRVREVGATFVTLEHHGRLIGCIGS